MRLFDEQTGYLKLDEIVQERPTFKKAVEDGKVTDMEMKDAMCELAVLYEMNAFREEQEG